MTTELEPAYVFNARLQERIDAATRAAIEATEAEQAAFQEVDRLRGDAKIGLIQRGAVLVAQRRLAKLQGEAADAAAAVRAVEREIARERTARQDVEAARARLERNVRDAERAHSKQRASALWAEIFGCLEELDKLPGLPPLSSAGRGYDMAMGSLERLRAAFQVK